MKTNYSGHKAYKLILAIILTVLLVLSDRISIPTVDAQGEQWSSPRLMPGFDPNSRPPILISDQYGIVHAFTYQWIGDEGEGRFRAIVYNQWTSERGWTNPIDIALSPSKEARLTDVYLDDSGVFHMTFFGGDNTSADIYYTKAFAPLVSASGSWSVPFIIGENASDPEVAKFVVDDEGTYFVVYNGRQQGNGLYVVSSRDGGENWSSPVPVFFTRSDEPNTAQLEVIRSTSGWFHAIWGVFNVAGQGRGIYYARSENGVDWSEPILLADEVEGLGTQKPTIIEYNGALLGIYLTDVQDSVMVRAGMKVMMRRSSDNGETWDGPFIVFPRHVGMNGDLSLVIDGNDDLHLFFGQRIPGMMPDLHGMWHSNYMNNRWLEPEAVVKGPRIIDEDGNTGFDPNFARAVVSQGNIILLTWMTDPAAGQNGIWYSYKYIDAPDLSVTPLNPTSGVDEPIVSVVEPPLGSETPEPVITLVSNGEDDHMLPDQLRERVARSDPLTSVWIGPTVALIVIVVVVAFYAMGKK